MKPAEEPRDEDAEVTYPWERRKKIIALSFAKNLILS